MSSSLSDFRAREAELRRLDEQLNDKQSQKQQSDRLARLHADSAAPPASSFGPGGQVHHPYGAEETGFLEETSGFRGRYETPAAAASVASRAAAAGVPARPAQAGQGHSRPVSAASQEGRRRSSAIPTPAGSAHAAAAVGHGTRTASASTAPRITPSGLARSAPRGRSAVPTAAAATAAPPAAPSAANDPYASYADPYADGTADDSDMMHDGAGDRGRSGSAADVGDEDDALGFGGDAGAGGDSGVPSTAGMGSAATLRVQKARIQALSANVSTLSATLIERDKELTELRAQAKAAVEGRDKLQRARESAEKHAQALQRSLDEALAKSHAAESKGSTLDRDLRDSQKRRAELEAECKAKDVKLNRALQDVERAKEALARTRNGGGGGGGGGAGSEESMKEIAALKLANKKLLQQRMELLQGFKKQARLVELLRKQKLHVEMAKMLQFTEEEFAKTLETGDM